MYKALGFVALAIGIFGGLAFAQSTNGLMTGIISDPSGAIVAGAGVTITNQGTNLVRTTSSGADGIYLVPQLPPGTYSISISKPGFATEERKNIQLEVNQSVTLDFKLGISSSTQTVQVTGAAPLLNTTSATLSDVVNHAETVDLPLNGRQFTQLTLLTPGAAPLEGSQQTNHIVELGAGSISPSVNGQRGEQDNYTMDGVLNNEAYSNIWAIAPPPDAIQEFNVQSHITDAQFAITSGANINVVTRSGTNTFHGSAWEFLRNDALDAQTFPETQRLPYRQNQYGVYVGGPIRRNSTWFSGYWEGFRSVLSQTILASTLTAKMQSGDFSGVLGAQVGTDSLGRPEYANEIYDPQTSRPDPAHPGEFLRDPFPGNKMLLSRINPVTTLLLQKYYPLPNLNVGESVLPNLQFIGKSITPSDVFGIRIDHQFNSSNTAFIRFNRSHSQYVHPETLPTYIKTLIDYAQQAAAGYTYVINSKAILNLHYGYTYSNFSNFDEPPGAAFVDQINFGLAFPPHDGYSLGPQISLANGFTGTSQSGYPFGPLEGMDYHVDLSKIAGNHTIGVGAMYYHIHSYADGWNAATNFTQNATAQDGQAGPTGYAPASFILGALDSYGPTVGNSAADQTINWYGVYAQDQWQATKKLVVTVGLRWDYVAPPNYHKIVSGLNVLNGQFIVTGAVPAAGFPKATGSSGFYNPQYNGFEPRFGVSYQATKRTVLHGAFAMLDDHANTLIQENQNIRDSWPSSISANLTSLDLGLPTTFINNLPPAASFLTLTPYASYGADPDNRIPYSIEYNAGVQQQLSNSIALKIDYVGSVSRHQYMDPRANTALVPGPGAISARQPFPQYGGPFTFSWNEAPASYNALQAQAQKALSAGLFFLASYTWSKSLDWSSDPYSGSLVDFYNLSSNWGPSSYSLSQMFVLSGVYALPIGEGKSLLPRPNRVVQAVAGNWNVGAIVSLHSGTPFNALLGSDVANTGDTNERAERTGSNPYSAPGFHQNAQDWLNKAAFAVPTAYTFGNERRDDLVGPGYQDIDVNAYKDFPLTERATLQFRGELFNSFNHTNYTTPNTDVQSSSFGAITSTAGPGREVQFALKLLF